MPVVQAFVALETEVQKTGRLRSYGISSNSFSLPADHVHFLPYEGLLDLASKVSGQCRFYTFRCSITDLGIRQPSARPWPHQTCE